MKLTKQGVRNLDDLPGKSRGRKLSEPPKEQFCKHLNKREEGYTRYCPDCGMMWDWDGSVLGYS